METSIQTSEVSVQIGVTRRGTPVSLDLVSEAHAVVSGATRSGKSQVMYSILGQLAGQAAVRVVGIDPTYVLLDPFTQRGVPEPLIALGADADGMLRVVDALEAELERRIALLRQMGTDKFDSFSAAFPMIVVVLEEFPGTVTFLADHDAGIPRGDKTPKKLKRLQSVVRRLVRESAKVGMRVFILAQRADAEIIGGDVRANLSARICLRLDDSAGLRMMFETIDPQEAKRVETFPPGTGFIRTSRLPFDKFRSYFVGDYRRYASHVRSCDPRVLQALRVDRAFRMQSADEFPQYGDPDRADDDW